MVTKRFVDVALAVLLLLILAPVATLIGVMVWLSQGPPVLFSQARPGLRGKPFRMIKFRTMLDAIDSEGRPLPDSERLTRVGEFLRRTSLDEIPELWNVIRGDMSLVGPRPLLMEYLPLYTQEQCRRHELRPGVTGWAQVNGRNALTWEEKFRFDVWYVDNRSFLLDVKILMLTLITVLRREGINAKGEATMHRFTGTKVRQ